MMNTSFRRLLLPARSLLLSLALLTSAIPMRAVTDAEATAGRALVKKYADAIVGVELVVTLKMSMGDRAMPPREQKVEVNGTVIAASGLTVISLAEIDPRGALGNQPNLRMEEPDFKEVKLRLADNSEVAATIVLKDADLDLAFVAPLPEAAAGRTFSFVKLEEAAEPTVLSTLFLVSRGSKVQQRTPLVVPANIIGLIEKPRRMILATNYALSCPAFDLQGKLLGLCLRNLSGGRQAGLMIFPGPDIAEIAKQAAAIKPTPPAAVEAPALSAPAAKSEEPPAQK
jgi:hypothetical protein